MTTQCVMFLANLFSRICSARGQFVIVVANQRASSGKHVALLGKSTNFQACYSMGRRL